MLASLFSFSSPTIFITLLLSTLTPTSAHPLTTEPPQTTTHIPPVHALTPDLSPHIRSILKSPPANFTAPLTILDWTVYNTGSGPCKKSVLTTWQHTCEELEWSLGIAKGSLKEIVGTSRNCKNLHTLGMDVCIAHMTKADEEEWDLWAATDERKGKGSRR